MKPTYVSLIVLWTVSSLVICRAVPADSQALAGSVFNSNSVGLAVTAVIAASVSAHSDSAASDTNTPTQAAAAQLLQGYRAAYWTIFAGMVVCLVSSLGLRNVGKVGIKRD